MSQAWKILLALTFARISMGVQFQAIPALAIPLTASGEMSFVALGTLTGAYLLPGAVVALVGGWLAHRVGDARVAFAGLGLMTVGGFAGWAADSYEAAVLWRLVAGIGAVGLNVMLTKMAADWFDGRDDLTTAMGVLVSSWPAGIAIAALILPLLAAAQGVQTALLVPAVICAIGWAGLWLIWKEPKRAVKPAGAAETSGFTGREITLVVLAGSIWTAFNIAFVGVIAWTPPLLEQAGLAPLVASTSASFIGWAAIFAVALGGWLSSRVRRKDAVAIMWFALSAASVVVLPGMGQGAGAVWVMIWVGVVISPAAAMIMALTVQAARPHLRALVMGIYFAIYYAGMGIAPVLLGALAEASGGAEAPIYAICALQIFCIVAWIAFRRLRARSAPPA